MTLQMRNWRVDLSHILFLGFKGDSHAETFTLLTDFEEDFDLKLDVELEGQKNIIQLFKTADKTYSVTLTRDMTGANGIYKAQIRGTLGETVKHSNIFALCIGDSINAEKSFPPSLPSEFEQTESRINELNNNPPKASDTGFWEIYDTETKQYVQSDIPLPEGKEGKAATVKIGSVTEGETASVTNRGTETSAVFDFVLPVPKASGVFWINAEMGEMLDSDERTRVCKLILSISAQEIKSALTSGKMPVLTLPDMGIYIPLVGDVPGERLIFSASVVTEVDIAAQIPYTITESDPALLIMQELGGGGGESTPRELKALTMKSFNYTALNGEDGFSIGDDASGSRISWHPRNGFQLYRPSTITYVGGNTLPNLDMAARQAGNPLAKTILVPPNAINLELFVGIELFGTADLAADPTVWTVQNISADGTIGTQQAAVSALTDSLTVGDLSITAAEANRKISITNNGENYVLFTHMWPYSHFTKW